MSLMDEGPGISRRAIDVIVSFIGLIVFSPVLAMAAVAVLATSGRPVLFRQARVGQGERIFIMYKLRTMRPSRGALEVTGSGDTRVTRVGRFLRRSSLDEVPQLWNVLRGSMTLVGPRPEVPSLAGRYPDEARAVLSARPGLTGPAQIRLRDRTVMPPPGVVDLEDFYLREVVPARAKIDLEYLSDPTLVRTVAVLLETVVRVAVPGRPVTLSRAPAVVSRSSRNGR